MMKRLTGLLLLAPVLTGCASFRVHTDYDHQATFAPLRTYRWIAASEEAAPAGVAPFLERRLMRAVDTVLAARGFRRITEGEADFLVDAYVVGDPGPDSTFGSRTYRAAQLGLALGFGFGRGFSRFGDGFGYGGFGYPYFGFGSTGLRGFGFPYFGFPSLIYSSAAYPYAYGGYAERGTVLDGYLPGTLVVDVFEASSGELIWRGSADRAMLYAPEGDGQAEFLDKAIGRILQDFPPTDAR